MSSFCGSVSRYKLESVKFNDVLELLNEPYREFLSKLMSLLDEKDISYAKRVLGDNRLFYDNDELYVGIDFYILEFGVVRYAIPKFLENLHTNADCMIVKDVLRRKDVDVYRLDSIENALESPFKEVFSKSVQQVGIQVMGYLASQYGGLMHKLDDGKVYISKNLIRLTIEEHFFEILKEINKKFFTK